MIEPAEEIYVIFNKKTGSIKTGSGRKYKLVHAYLSEKMGWVVLAVLVSSPAKRRPTMRLLSTILSKQRRIENDYQFQ